MIIDLHRLTSHEGLGSVPLQPGDQGYSAPSTEQPKRPVSRAQQRANNVWDPRKADGGKPGDAFNLHTGKWKYPHPPDGKGKKGQKGW